MMALSMAVIASVIGAGGLGDRVYQALASVDVGAALAAGIPIVLLAVVLDRMTGAAGERLGARRRRRLRRCAAGAAGPGVAVVAVAVARGRTARRPPGLARRLDRGHRRAGQPRQVDWMVDHLYSGVPVVGGTADWAAHFTTWVLDPLRDGLQGAALVVGAAASSPRWPG